MTESRTKSSGAARPGGGRAARAREEPMTVRALRDGRYVVETEGGTYVVDLRERSCTCPDHSIRGTRCKHLRRVAIEVTTGAIPAPEERRGVCAVCGTAILVARTEGGPHCCDRHRLVAGDLVRDRELGGLLVVDRWTGDRADDHRTEEGRLVADYATNVAYGRHEPVVEAAYVDDVERSGLDDARRYAFPTSRLVPVDPS